MHRTASGQALFPAEHRCHLEEPHYFLGYRSFRTDNLLPSSFVRRPLSYFVSRLSQNPSDNFFSYFAGPSGMSRSRHSAIFILLESFVFKWRPFLCQKWPFWGVFGKLQKNCLITFFLFFPRIKPISVPYRSPSLNGLELFVQIL